MVEITNTMDVFCNSPFWDVELIWKSETPDFTACFHKTALVWLPCIFLWIALPLEVYFIRTTSPRIIPWSTPNYMKIIAAAFLVAFTFLDLLCHIIILATLAAVEIYSSTIKFITMIAVLSLIIAERKRGMNTTGILYIFWLLQFACNLITYRSLVSSRLGRDRLKALASHHIGTRFDSGLRLPSQNAVPHASYTMFMICFPLVMIELVYSSLTEKNDFDDQKNKRTVKRKTVIQIVPCPEGNASFFSRMVFSWVNGLIIKGYKRPLLITDLWALEKENTSSHISARFGDKWDKERARKGKDSSLARSIFRAFGWEFFIAAVLKLISDMLVFANPIMLKKMIEFVTSDEPTWHGYYYAGVMFTLSMVQSIFLSQHNHRSQYFGTRVKTALMLIVYSKCIDLKALRITTAVKKNMPLGEIVNLMAVDSQNIVDMLTELAFYWSGPLQIFGAIYMLWRMLGVAAFAGVVVMLVVIPINTAIASVIKSLQVKMMKNRDKRLKTMNEVLSGIKVLKLYAWEMSFYRFVQQIRGAELKDIKKIAFVKATVLFLFQVTPILVSVATLGTYVMIKSSHVLDATKVFVSLSLLALLRAPLNSLPTLITMIIQSSVSFHRVEAFMNADEIDPKGVDHVNMDGIVVYIKDGTFAWGPDEPQVISDIELQVKSGELVLIVGPVGSGKSTLLISILGETKKINGLGTVSYVSQQAWIKNTTLRKNILFGKKLNIPFYDEVIHSCALGPDLELLPGRDYTEIGEKGVNLSGGQKQRVSLARAVYSDADIVLLDDPLSSVDSHVGKHIIDHIIGPNGMLRRKTRILATHNLACLPYADQIIVLNHGRISETGTFKDLVRSKGAFSDYLKMYLKTKNVLDELESHNLKEEEDIIGEIKDTELKRSKDSVQSDTIEGTKGSTGSIRKSETTEEFLSKKECLACASAGQIVKRSSKMDLSQKMPISSSSPLLRRPHSPYVRKILSQSELESRSKLITEEMPETGVISWDVYTYYVKSMGLGLGLAVILFCFFSEACILGANIWLTKWSSDPPLPNGTQNIELRNYRLKTYAFLGLGQTLFMLCGAILVTWGTLRASRILHEQMLFSVLHSPMEFFDQTPMGRLMNRFSKDMEVADETVPRPIRPLITHIMHVVATVYIITNNTRAFGLLVPPLSILYYLIQKVYLCTSRQLKRLEAISRSPIFAQFSETVTGLSTIRAYKKEKEFIKQTEEAIDTNQILTYPRIAVKRWLALRLDFIGQIVVFSSGAFAAYNRENVPPGIVGLTISYAVQVTHLLSVLVRMAGDLENSIVSVERIKEYTHTPQEKPWEIIETKPKENWPEVGHVKFIDFSLRYRQDLEYSLINININIKGGEKIGLVGRTGSGKSSLTLALFRIIEGSSGRIIIDDLDISTLGLHDLRSKLTIIPQEPMLFSGTLRLNLDPLQQHSDSEIMEVLRHANLMEFIAVWDKGVEFVITEGGENLSIGQRQLVCLARALLRKSKILVLDEATAAVDLETDDHIQKTIKSEFRNCTVITIAHRLNTIMDSNRVIVLVGGQVVEFDTPEKLLAIKSVFRDMAQDAGLYNPDSDQDQDQYLRANEYAVK
uniref:ABC-type glutathione-S-conjugate transporter n=1 Tax=Strigamia maritima TaxID=126957 RepID=T1JB97_STRMM